MSWLKKHWRVIALAVASALAGGTGAHTYYQKSGAAVLVPQVIQAIPCTPGEANCPSAPPAK